MSSETRTRSLSPGDGHGFEAQDARVEPAASAPRPRLRGWSHAAAAVAAAMALWLLSPRAIGADGALAGPYPRLFLFAMVALFTLSALYHVGYWTRRTRALLRRLDHACIFFFITACMCPMIAAGEDPALRTWSLNMLWALTAAAMFGVMFRRIARRQRTAMYTGLGVLGAALVAISGAIPGLAAGSLLFGAGLLHLGGALVYVRRWPDPMPCTFGYHEVFHLIVIAANAMMLVALFGFPAGGSAI